MRFSAPIYHLKRQAKLLSRKEKIPLHEALDRIAVQEGFRQWSLLSARFSSTTTANKVFSQCRPGDLALIAARPGQGKTLMSIEILAQTMKAGNRGVFFTLEYTAKNVTDLFREIGVEVADFGDRFELETSDAISAPFIMKRLAAAPHGTIAVIDYLQLLDQQREKPRLADQVQTLQTFARDRGLVIVFLSQIDRSYDPSAKPCPDLSDVRLPNPLDVKLFNKTCFLHDGEVRFRAAS
jgi:replicative DNA helicase